MPSTILKGLVLAATLTAMAGSVLAEQRHVRWADQGAAMPRSEGALGRRLGPGTRAAMRQRGALAQAARAPARPGVRFDEAPRRAGAGYNNVHYDRRVAQPRSILKGSAANRGVHAERRFTRNLGSSTRATMTHRGNVARHARRSSAIKSTLSNTARSGRYARTAGRVGRAAAGGFVATYAVESALGVDVPDVVDAAEWTYGTLRDPSQVPQRFERLGRDSLRTLDKAGRTLTNPAQMGRNLESAGKEALNAVNKAGCTVGGLFGAKC